MLTACGHRALIVRIFFIQVDSIWCSQINVLTFITFIVQRACSVHTAYIHIIILYMISFKFIAWVQGVYSPKTGCILLCFLILCGNMFPDIVHVHIIVLYDLFYIYSVGTGCVQPKERVNYCVLFILCGNMFLSQMALHICPVILVTALAYANTAGSAVFLANYTLLFGKCMHLWIHVLVYGLI